MDIMLVGGVSPMMKKLSLKLHKEGHRVEIHRISMNMHLSGMIFLTTMFLYRRYFVV